MTTITTGVVRACTPLLLAGLLAAGCQKAGKQEAAPAAGSETGAPAHADSGVQVADWCAGHGLPESMCTKCNPELVAKFKEAGDWCAEHGFPESACPQCNPMQPPAGVPPTSSIETDTRIRIRSPEIERAAGFRVAVARDAEMGVGIECTARIDFDGNRVADIRAPIAGVVQSVEVDLGAAVRVDTPLFVLESPSVGEIQGQLRAARQRAEVARADFARQESLHAAGVTAARQVELARQEMETAVSELESAEASLRIAGAPADGREGRYELRSPIAGTVVRRPATVGTFATDETSLATIADTRVMWALLDIGELDATSVAIGTPVTIRVEGGSAAGLAGRITWISAEVDPRTRTVSARAEVPNLRGELRANQFVRAVIHVARPEGALSVPRESVQRLGEESVVFVRTGEGLYESRIVILQRRAGGLVQVSGNLRAGDEVVTDGAYLLKTEMSRESIGAGCCEAGPGVAGR